MGLGFLTAVRSIAFHPYDSAILASAGDDRTVRIWNAITGEQMGVLEGHDDWVRDITWHPEGEMLASSGDDRTVRIWMDVLSDDPEKPVAILDDANDWVRPGCRRHV